MFVCLSQWMWVAAQEVYPDNVEDSDCTVEATEQPWDAQVLHYVNDIHGYFVPIVGDIDGDGVVEIVTGKVVTHSHYTSLLGVYRGTDLLQIGTINVPQQIYAGFADPVAIVRYPDGNGGMQGAIILHCYDNMLRSYDIHGNLLAVSDSTTPCEGAVSVTDFNYDGWPELYVGNVVYDAATLRRLCAGPSDGNKGRSWRGGNGEMANTAMSLAADVLGDSIPELICGNTIYRVDIVSRTDVSLNSVTELKTISIPSRIPQDGNVAVADFDKDGRLDVLVVIDATRSEVLDTTYFYVYDPVTENILFIHGRYSLSTGYPLVGDIDGDGDLEIVYIDKQNQTYNSWVVAVTYNPVTGAQIKWQAPHEDESGQTSMTLFDFNQDGIMEIVYRDMSNLRIINGSGRSHITGQDTIPFYNLYTKSMHAGTWKEYPVVADVNGDGAAEIVVSGKVGSGLGDVGGQMWIIGGVHPWAPARPVWNQYMYNVTNINSDLTVPIPLFNPATTFVDPQGVVRRPFNNFLQQATMLDMYGRPFVPLANATMTNDTSVLFENNEMVITYRFCNTGSLVLNSPFTITYYANAHQGTVIHTETVNTPLQADDCMYITVRFTEAELAAYPDLDSIVVALNDNGNGIAQLGGQQEECDLTDNIMSFSINPCPIRQSTVLADICFGESYVDENFNISAEDIPEAREYHFFRRIQIGDCDSVVQLKLRVHAVLHHQIVETISQGADYNQHGLFIPQEMLSDVTRIDTCVVLESVYGCDSVLDITLYIAFPEVELYLPNAITANKDGENDVFSIPEWVQSQIADFEIHIFNRWGEIVYYSPDKNFRRDGHVSANGSVYHSIVYVYIIRYTDLKGKNMFARERSQCCDAANVFLSAIESIYSSNSKRVKS